MTQINFTLMDLLAHKKERNGSNAKQKKMIMEENFPLIRMGHFLRTINDIENSREFYCTDVKPYTYNKDVIKPSCTWLKD